MKTEDGEGGNAKSCAEARARVREVLIAPMLQLRLPAKLVAADYEKLVDHLSYLTPDALDGLAEYCLICAGGGMRPVVGAKPPKAPAPAMIRAWAHALQSPPPRENVYVASLMRSALGDAAYNGGWHVELYRAALRNGPPPPSGYAQAQLRAKAEEGARSRARIRERIEAGNASEEDVRIMDSWSVHARHAADLVLEGRAARQAALAAGVAA